VEGEKRMRIAYKPDPYRDAWVYIDIPIPAEVWKGLDVDKIAEYVCDQLAKRYAKVRGWELDDPRVLAYKQGQFDWVRGWLIEHVFAVLEKFRGEVVG
jgi:hypothetical protein